MTPDTEPYPDGSAFGAFDAWIAALARDERRERTSRRALRARGAGRPDDIAVRGNPPLDGEAMTVGTAALNRVLGW